VEAVTAESLQSRYKTYAQIDASTIPFDEKTLPRIDFWDILRLNFCSLTFQPANPAQVFLKTMYGQEIVSYYKGII
jgi:hypothetical protein